MFVARIGRIEVLLDKMAAVVNSGQTEFCDVSQVLSKVGPIVAHYLIKVEVEPIGKVVEELSEDVEPRILSNARETLFTLAVQRYHAQLNAIGMTDMPTLSLKRRQGDSIATALSQDLCELFVYVSDLRSQFPRTVLSGSCKASFIDVIQQTEQHSGTTNNMQRRPNENSNCRCEDDLSEAHRKIAELTSMYRTLEKLIEKEREDRDKMGQKINEDIQRLKADKTTSVVRECACTSTMTESMSRDGQINSPLKANEGQSDDQQAVTPDNNIVNSHNEKAKNNHPNHQTTEKNNGSSSSSDGDAKNSSDQQSVARNSSYAAVVKTGKEQSQQHSHNEANVDVEPKESESDIDQQCIEHHATWSQLSHRKSQQKPKNVTFATLTREGTKSTSKHMERRYSSSSTGSTTSNTSSEYYTQDHSSRKSSASSNDADAEENFHTVLKRREYRENKKNKKIKQFSQPPPSKPRMTLTGQRPEEAATMYLENIRKDDDCSKDDIVQMVKEHARNNGLRIMSAWIVLNKVCHDVVGCRITIPVRSMDKAVSEGFWPDGIHCRRWHRQKPRAETKRQRERHDLWDRYSNEYRRGNDDYRRQEEYYDHDQMYDENDRSSHWYDENTWGSTRDIEFDQHNRL